MAKKKETIERDVHDGGVPMLAASEPRGEAAGPEDALGLGPKRGDYSGRVGGADYNPHTVVAVEHDDGEGGVTVEQVAVAQKPLVDNVGDEVGLKGGVDTHTDRAAAESSGNIKGGSGSSSGSDSGSSS